MKALVPSWFDEGFFSSCHEHHLNYKHSDAENAPVLRFPSRKFYFSCFGMLLSRVTESSRFKVIISPLMKITILYVDFHLSVKILN